MSTEKKPSPETIGGEPVEYHELPEMLQEHLAFEKALNDDYVAPDTEPLVKAVVSARVPLGFLRGVEFIELPKTTDLMAELYPHYAWVKIRNFLGFKLVYSVVLQMFVLAACVVAATFVQYISHVVALIIVGVLSMGFISRRMSEGVIIESQWYTLTYQQWSDTVHRMDTLHDRGVSRTDISEAAVIDLHHYDEANRHQSNSAHDSAINKTS